MNQVIKLETGNKVAGIIPRSLEEVYVLAEKVAKSGTAPNGTKDPNQIAIAILHGLEVGLSPMLSIQKISIIGNRPSLWGDAIPAILLAKGFKIEDRVEGEGENQVAICKVTRPDGSVTERRFSVDDAKRAQLWMRSKTWQQYPSRMLLMRARSFAARDGASDVLCGLYTTEEAQDIVYQNNLKDITPTVEVVDVQQTSTISQTELEVLKEALSVPPANDIEAFLRYFEIEELEDLPKSRLEEAHSLIKQSKAARAKKGGK